MGSGRYQCRPPVHGLPPDLSRDGSSASSSIPNYQLPSHIHGLPREYTHQQISNTWPPMPNHNFNLVNSMSPGLSSSQASAEWIQSHPSTVFGDQSTNGYFPYSGNNSGSHHGGVLLPDHSAGVPRSSWSAPYDGNMLNDSTISTNPFEPSYTTEPMAEGPKSCGLRYDQQQNSPDFARLSISLKIENDGFDNVPFSFDGMPSSRMPLSESSSGLPSSWMPASESSSGLPSSWMPASESSEESVLSSRAITPIEEEDHGDHGAVETYAKLIYRALMSVENHAMVLQEIYHWFRENTNRASSDTKGWKNSIRHNLSMNAAFKKTERRVSGDETKKSTGWVLEEFAIKNGGVQSTTRYRKGKGSKKSARSDNPTRARQSSGRQGGVCTSRNRIQRQRFRDERPELRRSTPRVGTGMWAQFSHNGRTSQVMHGHITPVTSNADSVPSAIPSFVRREEVSEDMGGLPEGIRGLDRLPVFPDDSRIFSNTHGPSYHNSTPSTAAMDEVEDTNISGTSFFNRFTCTAEDV